MLVSDVLKLDWIAWLLLRAETTFIKVERRRREKINERIRVLGALLPEACLDYHGKVNKGIILKATVDYIRELQRDRVNTRWRMQQLEHELAVYRKAYWNTYVVYLSLYIFNSIKHPIIPFFHETICHRTTWNKRFCPSISKLVNHECHYELLWSYSIGNMQLQFEHVLRQIWAYGLYCKAPSQLSGTVIAAVWSMNHPSFITHLPGPDTS